MTHLIGRASRSEDCGERRFARTRAGGPSGLLLRGGREGERLRSAFSRAAALGFALGLRPRSSSGKGAEGRSLRSSECGGGRFGLRLRNSGGGQALSRPGRPYIRRPASFAGITDRRKSVLRKSVMAKSLLGITLSSVIMRASLP